MKFAPDVESKPEKHSIVKNDDLVLGTASRSFELESWSYFQHQDYQLHILQKKEFVSSRRPIPATETQRHDFIRLYTNCLFKTEFIAMMQLDVTFFFKSIVLTSIFVYVPYYYVVMFLSSYCPDEHLYLPKMVPIMWGTKWLIIISSWFQIQAYTDVLMLIFDYVISALFFQNPWNKCHAVYAKKKFVEIPELDKKLQCFSYIKFKYLMNTGNITQKHSYFVKGYPTTSVSFWSSQMQYFNANKFFFIDSQKFSLMTVLYRVFLWITAFGFTYLVYKKIYWKILRICCWTMVTMYIIISVTTSLEFLEKDIPPIKAMTDPIPHSILKLDISLLVWSVACPPVLHILYSRKQTQLRQASPGWDSAMLVTSNTIFVFLSVYAMVKMTSSVDSEIGFHYVWDPFNSYLTLFYIPIYFTKVYFGDILTLVYFIDMFGCEFCTFSFMIFTLIEIIKWEWPDKRVKNWMVMIPLFLTLFLTCIPTTFYTRLFLWIFSSLTCGFFEVLSIVVFYPINRFIDDITFHFGTAPIPMRIYMFYIFPIKYLILLKETVEYIVLAFRDPIFNKVLGKQFQTFTTELWIIPLIPVALGMIYAFVKYVVREKKKVCSLFRPLSKWGPPDHVTRQLRKQFDSREYVPSQSSRYLSRHMMAKAEAATYKLDVRYQSAADANRRSTFKFEHEYESEDSGRVPRIQRRHSSEDKLDFFSFNKKE